MVKDLCTVNMKEALTASGCLSTEALLTILWNRPINRYAVSIEGKLDLPAFDKKGFKERHPDCVYITTSENISSNYGDEEEFVEDEETGLSLVGGKIVSSGTIIFFNDKIIELASYTVNVYYIDNKEEVINVKVKI